MNNYQEEILATVPAHLHAVVRQEWTYFMNTSPGWRPSDALRACAKRVLDGHKLYSPTAQAMLER